MPLVDKTHPRTGCVEMPLSRIHRRAHFDLPYGSRILTISHPYSLGFPIPSHEGEFW